MLLQSPRFPSHSFLGFSSRALSYFAAELSCKRKLRPTWDLDQWQQQNLRQRPWPAPLPWAKTAPQRIHASQKEGNLKLIPFQPAIIEGALDTWPEGGRWSLNSLLVEHGDTEFVVGAALHEDTSSTEARHEPVRMTLHDYHAYAHHQQDDSPLYIFDDEFLEIHSAMALAYSRPMCFAEDLMDVLRCTTRVPYQGLLIGAERSGSYLHIDTLETSAWNSLISGKKRWVIFSPEASAWSLQGSSFSDSCSEKTENIRYETAAGWLHDKYPGLVLDAGCCFDFLQLPGETVYVPRGWWHCVVNLDFSVAVTENFVSRHDLIAAYRYLWRTEPEAARKWLAGLRNDPNLTYLTSGLEWM
eukprot:TRINITY_DN24727_c0_g1_i2.p1 TRINITY_DN24727_c0_g1~~TRINITY_DN24727_c0_g1_i2.p1  ORF type:complete len:357 (+),score=37.59 TRINITY_DN24727_c0_g1_i2:59-1129(+)